MHKVGWVILFMLLLTGGLVVAQDDYDPSNIVWRCPPEFEGQSLSVANWSGYMGSRTIRTFEELCGVEIEFDIYDSNEILLDRLRDSQSIYDYDVVFPSDHVVAALIRENLILPLDITRIPNIANLAEQWRETPFDPQNEYSVPYLWGTTSLVFNAEKVTQAPQTWMDFFTYEGKVAWLNDTRTMMSIALSVLGYDPNSASAEEIEAARVFLSDHAANVYEIADDNGQALMEEGLVDMAVEYSGDIYQLVLDCECEDYIYIIPEEGTVFDLGLMVIPSRANNPALAHAFIDYIHDPYVNASIMNDSGYATTNQLALESGFVYPELLDNPVINPDIGLYERSWMLQDVGTSDLIYSDEWSRLLNDVGK